MSGGRRLVAAGCVAALLAAGIARPTPVLSGPATSPVPLTLTDCYDLALKRSEAIGIRTELIAATEGRFMRSLSAALPRASFTMTQKWQDQTASAASRVPERSFGISQPLFSGFKEFAAMAGARAERRQRIHERTRAEHLLMVDVSDAFYLLLQQREELRALEVSRIALMERIDELKQREQLGRSRPSEVVSVEAQLRRVEADIEQVRSREQVALELLEFLTGLDAIPAIADASPELPALASESDYLAKAPARPDVAAADEARRVAQKKVRVAQADLFPNVDVESRYYQERAGASADIDWDVLLSVDVPLFQGGQAVGAIREAAAGARQAKLEAQLAERQAVSEIRQAYTKAQSSIARTVALEKALSAAEDNYRLQVEDYRLSLVSNLEVLQALQSLESARRDVIGARYETKRLYWQLRAAAGESL